MRPFVNYDGRGVRERFPRDGGRLDGSLCARPVPIRPSIGMIGFDHRHGRVCLRDVRTRRAVADRPHVCFGIFIILVGTVSRRVRRVLGNADIAFWLDQPAHPAAGRSGLADLRLLSESGLLDTHLGLIVTYVATNLPIVIWLMRDYFYNVPDRARGERRGRRCQSVSDLPLDRPAGEHAQAWSPR